MSNLGKTRIVLNTVLNLPSRCYVLYKVDQLNPLRGRIQNPLDLSQRATLGGDGVTWPRSLPVHLQQTAFILTVPYLPKGCRAL